MLNKVLTVKKERLEKKLTPKEMFALLTDENKAKVNRQIEILVASQSLSQ